MDALDRACSHAGSDTKLAAALGISLSAIGNWRRRRRVPADKAVLIEAQFGVTVRELCPELFQLPKLAERV